MSTTFLLVHKSSSTDPPTDSLQEDITFAVETKQVIQYYNKQYPNDGTAHLWL